MRPIILLLLFGFLTTLSLACNVGCSYCYDGSCYSCYSNYMWDISQGDCVLSCTGTVDYNSDAYGGYAVCNDSSYSSSVFAAADIIYIVVPLGIFLLVIITCSFLARSRRMRRVRAMQPIFMGSPTPLNNNSNFILDQAPAINQVQIDASYRQNQVIQGVSVNPSYINQGPISYAEPYNTQQPYTMQQPVYGYAQPIYSN